MAERKTESERIESNRASDPDAIKAPEFTFFPCPLTYLPKKNFTTTARPITNIESLV